MTRRENTQDQSIDIGGSCFQADNLQASDEVLKFGRIINSGTGSQISVGVNVSLQGLSGITSLSEGRYIEVSGFTNPENDGYFLISSVVSSSEVIIENPDAVSEATVFSFNERNPYSLEDDINYIRTDRSNIKGVPYYADVPSYTVPDDIQNTKPSSLANIAGNTTDAVALIVNKEYYSQSVGPADTFITITDVGELKHADSSNILGIPVYDGYDINNDIATFAIITAVDGYGNEITVRNGQYAGWRIFGRTRQGSSTSPNSVEVQFMAVEPGAELSTAVPYTWEFGQVQTINVIIGVRKTLSSMEDVDLRRIIINGIIFGGTSSSGSSGSNGIDEFEHATLRQLIHLANGDGPYEGFGTGAHREITGSPFPTNITWYTDSLKTSKIVEKNIVRNLKKLPVSITWNAYDVDGSTILATVVDTINYSGVFEVYRTRQIS